MAIETTVQVFGKSLQETMEIVHAAPVDLLVHGPRDESAVFVTGEGAVLNMVRGLGLTAEVRETREAED